MERIEVVIEFHGIIFSWISLWAMRHHSGQDRAGRMLMAALVINMFNLAGDMAAIAYMDQTTPIAYVMVGVGNWLAFFCQILFLFAMSRFVFLLIKRQVPDANDRLMKPIMIVCGGLLIAFLLNPVTHWFYYIDEINDYHRGSLMYAMVVVSELVEILVFQHIIRYRRELGRHLTITTSLFFTIPLVTVAVQMLFYGFSYVNVGITGAILINCTMEMRREKMRRENERRILEQNKVYLLNSQIRPHFLFNALAVIQSLTEEKPELAGEAIACLADFLRKEIDLKTAQTTIPVKKELEYLKDYLYIEKLRFGDKLEIRYEIDESLNFGIPFLTIQPLVENAVRHGIRKRVEGGCVTIAVRKEEKNYTIRVEDNGVGFDMDSLEKKSQGNGIAMDNVRERVKRMCGGTMEINSIPGQGTKVLIQIPEK